MLIILYLFFVVIIIIQVPKFIVTRQWKDLVVYLSLLSLGIIYSIGIVYGWVLPNPTKKMEYLIEPIWKMLE